MNQTVRGNKKTILLEHFHILKNSYIKICYEKLKYQFKKFKLLTRNFRNVNLLTFQHQSNEFQFNFKNIASLTFHPARSSRGTSPSSGSPPAPVAAHTCRRSSDARTPTRSANVLVHTAFICSLTLEISKF